MRTLVNVNNVYIVIFYRCYILSIIVEPFVMHADTNDRLKIDSDKSIDNLRLAFTSKEFDRSFTL